jgi:subtilisin family serine protease
MDGPEAWDRTIGSDTVRVVILDTGVQQDHPDIHQVAGTDTTTDAGNGGPLNSFDNHGTPVGGCVAATIDNALGTVGIAPGCVVASARTFIGVNASGSWTSQASWTVASLSWAQSIGARVTNNSNYYGFQSSTIDQKYLETWNGGIVHFASAGNNGLGSITYPASLPIVNAVVAVGRDGLLTSFSNWGPGTDFAAPGISIYSTDRTGAAGSGAGDYSFVTGTSFASPYAAGVAALVLSSWPDASAAQVEQVLRGSCVDAGALGYDTTYGNGVVNARAALDVTCGGVSNFCSTSPNSVGPGAVMSVIGAPSVSANAFSLMASGCPPNSFGIFYMGPTATQVPFGNGFRCISGPIVRLPLVQANVFGDAIHQLDIPSLNPAAGIAPGATKRFQFWYRNSAGGGAGFNLSDGLQVRFCS